MNKKLTLTLFLAASTLLHGSGARESLPDPLWIRIPDGVTATVTSKRVRPLTEAEKADPIRASWTPDLVSATLTKSRGRLVIRYAWEGGKQSAVVAEAGKVAYQPSLRYPDDIQINGAGAPDLGRSDFPWLSWVVPEQLAGTESLPEGRAIKFLRSQQLSESKKAQRKAQAEAAAASLQHEHRQAFIETFLASNRAEESAWLDAKSLLPIRSSDGEMELAYSYRKATPAETAIPPEFARFFEVSARTNPDQ
jgi:hypothetical protein